VSDEHIKLSDLIREDRPINYECLFCGRSTRNVDHRKMDDGNGGWETAHAACAREATESTREKKPCVHCGYVRAVKVNRYIGSWARNLAGADVTEEGISEVWQALCTACRYRARAAAKLHEAQDFLSRAKAIEEKR
jgi:ribosomal protein L37E